MVPKDDTIWEAFTQIPGVRERFTTPRFLFEALFNTNTQSCSFTPEAAQQTELYFLPNLPETGRINIVWVTEDLGKGPGETRRHRPRCTALPGSKLAAETELAKNREKKFAEIDAQIDAHCLSRGFSVPPPRGTRIVPPAYEDE
ncbi:hypothetical protein FACS1894198_1180 [Clostridia bacterium]|nr:hypothetical protein FACS1894198_1180 [Clostridia bacterium]